MYRSREDHGSGSQRPAKAAVIWDVTWRVRRNLEQALAELRRSERDRAFFATTHGLEAAPAADRVTGHAVCKAQPCTRREGPAPYPSL